MNNSQLARERAVYDYLESLETGDIDGLIQSLQQAVYDVSLDQMLVNAHQTYFQQEQSDDWEIVVSAVHEASRAPSGDQNTLLIFLPRVMSEPRSYARLSCLKGSFLCRDTIAFSS